MSVVYLVLPSCLIFVAVLVAIAPWGAPVDAGYVLQVMPYMMAHLFVVREKWVVPSLVIFAAGIVMDIASDGPLGFWALIYLFGVLIARQLSGGLTDSLLGRLSGLLLVVFALAAAQVGVASLYQLKWIDWHAVLAGTLIAGAVTVCIDIVWRDRGADRAINVTARGAGNRPNHV